jgi:curved DNA-binding protein CbpA
MADFYEVLQVHPSAEPEVIRAAYRILARKYHPDHGGDARRMIELNDAWDVLGDPARRSAYDASRAGTPGRQVPGPGAHPAPEAGRAPDARTRSDSGVRQTSEASHAGPPPGRPSGTVLDFGRYSGWSLGEVARYDMDYLEWLQRATFGRRLRAEIEALLVQRRGPRAPGPTSSEGWKGRR